MDVRLFNGHGLFSIFLGWIWALYFYAVFFYYKVA